MADVYIALGHHPVYNRRREVIAAALTTLDLHDLARLAATYGLAGFFVVTPLEDQRQVAREMIEHWSCGWGAEYNPTRAEAVAYVRLARDMEEVKAAVAAQSGSDPVLVATTAGDGPDRVSFSGLRTRVKDRRPVVIVFGTGWGLSEEFLAGCELRLEPVRGRTRYNHLSVRSAAAIILDRLLGSREA